MKSVGFIVLVACGVVAYWLVKGGGSSSSNGPGASATTAGASAGSAISTYLQGLYGAGQTLSPQYAQPGSVTGTAQAAAPRNTSVGNQNLD